MTGSAKQSRATSEDWIASSFTRLAMTHYSHEDIVLGSNLLICPSRERRENIVFAAEFVQAPEDMGLSEN